MPRSQNLGMAVALALVLAGSASTLGAEPGLRPQAPQPDFMNRMMREARRELGRASNPLPIQEEIVDLEVTEARARQAERILRRSVRGALGDRLEPLLHALPAFEFFVKRRDAEQARGDAADGPALEPGSRGSAAPLPDRAFAGSLGFRLDAHPRLVLRGRLHGARGVLEVPVLDREIRLSIDQPIGALGTAALRGGVSRDRGEWVTLSINLSF